MCYFVHLLIILSFSQRKHETLEVDEDDSIIAESEVLWRINFERFIFCLKKKVCLCTSTTLQHICRCMYSCSFTHPFVLPFACLQMGLLEAGSQHSQIQLQTNSFYFVFSYELNILFYPKLRCRLGDKAARGRKASFSPQRVREEVGLT